MTAIVLSNLSDCDDVEDLKQEVWIRTVDWVRSGKAGDIPLTVKGIETHKAAWKRLLASAWQGALANFVRAEKRRRDGQSVLETEARHDSGTEAARPDRLLEHFERRELLERAINILPDPVDRAVVMLHHLEGYTVEEVAIALGLPLRSTELRLHDARQELAKRLGGRKLDLLPE